MPFDTFRIGITRDTLRGDGQPIFDLRALRMFEEPPFSWEFIPDDVTELTPAHAANYDALCVLRPRVTAATVSGPDRRLKIVARMGVGYDTIDVPACTANGVILTNTPDGVRRPVATSILLRAVPQAGNQGCDHARGTLGRNQDAHGRRTDRQDRGVAGAR